MFLAMILYCSVVTDASTCDVMIRKDHLFNTQEQCLQEMNMVAQELVTQGHYVKGKCFSFIPFGQST